jgi:hypothetical protein
LSYIQKNSYLRSNARAKADIEPRISTAEANSGSSTIIGQITIGPGSTYAIGYNEYHNLLNDPNSSIHPTTCRSSRFFLMPYHFAGRCWDLCRQGLNHLTGQQKSDTSRGNFTMQSKLQPILRHSGHLSLITLLVAAVTFGQMACAQKVAVKATQEYAHNVDPFIGVDWGGNTFVGSAKPLAW